MPIFNYLADWLSSNRFVPKLNVSRCEQPVLFRATTLDGAHTEELSLEELIRSRCPSLTREFRPVWWLNSGHLQTIYGVVGNLTNMDPVVYERVHLRTVDGGTIGLDFTPKDGTALPLDTPIVVVLHGLTGGSYESYVRSVLAVACKDRASGGLGYRGVVVNFRAGVPLTSPRIYSAGTIEDISTALVYLSQEYPNAKLLGVGFSLGANVLTRYLAETGSKSRFTAGCVLACPWNLNKNSERLEGGIFSRTVYSKAMGKNLVSLARKHQEALQHGAEKSTVGEELDLLLSGTTFSLREVDEHLVRHIGGPSPPFPFSSAEAYYTWASTHEVVARIRVPFLAINAIDDPIVQEIPSNIGKEGYTAIVVTNGGGHLGWFEGDPGTWMGVDRWVKKPVIEWLRAMGDSLVVSKDGAQVDAKYRDGFYCDPEQVGVGYQVIAAITESGPEEGLLPGL